MVNSDMALISLKETVRFSLHNLFETHIRENY